jgi:hypothetical protein
MNHNMPFVLILPTFGQSCLAQTGLSHRKHSSKPSTWSVSVNAWYNFAVPGLPLGSKSKRDVIIQKKCELQHLLQAACCTPTAKSIQVYVHVCHIRVRLDRRSLVNNASARHGRRRK